MKNSNYTVQIIEPSEGMWLKQKSATEIKDITFAKKVYLAINDSPDNWEEVTDEYKTEIEQKQKELLQKELQEKKENKEVNQ